MNKIDAKIIAETISNKELLEMFDNAKLNIINWNKSSIVNKKFTIGFVWNILTKNFNIDSNCHILTKINMIKEFSDYLPNKFKTKRKTKTKNIQLHEDPIF